MGKIQSFTKWLEVQGIPDPNQTHDMPKQGNKSTLRDRQSDVSTADPNRTGAPGSSVHSNDLDFELGPVGRPNSPIDPDIASSAQSLQGIHSQLRNIFVKAREKAHAFRYPQVKSAFDRQLMTGIDSIGRAHAIILPTARGIER